MGVKELVQLFEPPHPPTYHPLRHGTTSRALSSSAPNSVGPRQDHQVKALPGAASKNHQSSHTFTSTIPNLGKRIPSSTADSCKNLDSDDGSAPSLKYRLSARPPRSHTSDTPSESTLAPSPIPFADPVPKHSPIPATEVFSRRAAPLYLPKLDKYLASIAPPDFQHSRPAQPSSMFSPMDILAASGKSLADLEANHVKAPPWIRRSAILGAIVNGVLGVTGSSLLASFYSLQGVFNTVQIFALILSTIVPVGGRTLGDKWKTIFLGTVPNVLALNFASTLMESLVFLIVFMAIATGLLYKFYTSSTESDRYDADEGLQTTAPKGMQWPLVIVAFLLTTIYLPLSTMAVHVLVWSQDLWAVPNPYLNATSFPPSVPPLGPSNEYRDPLDFCWTTTMKRNEVNYAPAFVLISVAIFLALGIWYPIALYRAISRQVPIVDKFTELGRRRNTVEMDQEYIRLLDRDQHPFSFLYRDFRRGWGTYESIFLAAKFTTLFIIAVIDPNNCFFRDLPRSRVSIARQILLLITTIAFFAVQCIYTPFLDPVNNASEWVSRLNYVTTSAVALAVVLEAPGKGILETYVLYVIYAVTYGFTIYFIFINFGWMQRNVKRLTKRIDFSIDIFSPRLDLSSTSPHTKRRIWQESVSTLILTSPECSIPLAQDMIYIQARDSEFPPYLLDFAGTAGERHVENLKILREVGIFAYNKALATTSGPNRARYGEIASQIQARFTGPDSYWKPQVTIPELSSRTGFGNAWWIPFPPTLVMRYDHGPLVVLKELADLEEYMRQNSFPDVERRRKVRLLLRTLDNQTVLWPYEHVIPVGEPAIGWFKRKYYHANKTVYYRSCVLRIKRRGNLMWNGFQLGSGFAVELEYEKDVVLTGDAIGLNDDFELTGTLAKFFTLNEPLMPLRLKELENMLHNYRLQHRKVSRWKNRVLTYGFLTNFYNKPFDVLGAPEDEHDPRVRQMIAKNQETLRGAYERLKIVSRSPTTTWWYLFWDDLWRRNYDTISGLENHATDFNPYYPTSIAYTPLPRAALETFLHQRGLLSKQANSFFTSGFLNKMYVRLNDTVFRSSGQAILFHLGDGNTERDMIEIDLETRVGPGSTLGTGGGTGHNNSWIMNRPDYRWEGILADPLGKGKLGRRNLLAKFCAWLGLSNTWRDGIPTSGLALDVRLENGRYLLIEEH